MLPAAASPLLIASSIDLGCFWPSPEGCLFARKGWGVGFAGTASAAAGGAAAAGT